MAGASSRELSRHLNTLFQCGATGQISDAELLERFVAGRGDAAEAAFAALVERHGVMVLGVCRRVLGNRDEAEDAFQATFLVLAKKAAAIARREQLASWLHGVARHAALDARTRAARQKAREKRWGAMRPVDPPDRALASELHAVLDEEVARLPERHRAAIVLCELEGLSRRDAAAQLGVSEGTLSSRLSRAKSRLRDSLTRRGFALSAAALTSALTQDAHAVLLPPVLVDSTIHVATKIAAGSSLAGVVSTSVATLTEGVLKAMLLAKLKYAFLGLVMLAVVSSGVGVMAQQGGGFGAQSSPSDTDRLKAVERKLDRLLEVMGGTRRQSTPDTAPAAAAATAPALAQAAPSAVAPPAAAPPPPAVSARAPAPPPPPVGAPVPLPPAAPRTSPPDDLTDAPAAKSRFRAVDLGRRVDAVEQRLVDLERRFGELERRLNQSAFFMGGRTNPKPGAPPRQRNDAPPPAPDSDLEPPPSADPDTAQTVPAPPDAPPSSPDIAPPLE
jgi:RNA polymerase sigma factor (sigma-70 family)